MDQSHTADFNRVLHLFYCWIRLYKVIIESPKQLLLHVTQEMHIPTCRGNQQINTSVSHQSSWDKEAVKCLPAERNNVCQGVPPSKARADISGYISQKSLLINSWKMLWDAQTFPIKENEWCPFLKSCLQIKHSVSFRRSKHISVWKNEKVMQSHKTKHTWLYYINSCGKVQHADSCRNPKELIKLLMEVLYIYRGWADGKTQTCSRNIDRLIFLFLPVHLSLTDL